MWRINKITLNLNFWVNLFFIFLKIIHTLSFSLNENWAFDVKKNKDILCLTNSFNNWNTYWSTAVVHAFWFFHVHVWLFFKRTFGNFLPHKDPKYCICNRYSCLLCDLFRVQIRVIYLPVTRPARQNPRRLSHPHVCRCRPHRPARQLMPKTTGILRPPSSPASHPPPRVKATWSPETLPAPLW